jgi:adenylate cyclase
LNIGASIAILYRMWRREMSLRTRLFLIVAAGSILTATAAYLLHFRFLDNLERQTIDLRFSIRGDRSPPKDVVIVKVDDVTFSDHPPWRWPFDRSVYAETLDQIRKGDPKAVAFDIQFSELGSIAGDNALGNAFIRNRGRTVTGTTEVTDAGKPNLFFADALRELGVRAGNANLPTDKDGFIRRFPYEVERLKGFAVTAAEVAAGKEITRGDMGGEMQWIDYAGSPGTIPSYSLSRVHDGKVPPSAFKDKVVVVGATAPTLQDIHATPTGAVMSGPEIQANAVETALRGFPLRSLSTLWNIVLIVALGLIVPLISVRAGPLFSVGVGIFAFILFSLGTQGAFHAGRISSYVYPMAALAMATVGSMGIHYAVAAFERERVRDVFSRFVPEQVVDQVLAEADASDLRLHGKEMVTTVLFSDLRGFTSSAENMPAENVITVLNYYLHEMSEAILAHGGTLVCYMGDGIYAIFGAPLEQEDHADRAMLASREMLLERLPKFNAWMREQGYGEGYFMGIGLNSGPVMTGNVGHERRMDYTAVGDVTNTASRIEGMTKGTPFSVLIAESTIEMMTERPTDIVYYDELEVRGRVAKLKLWALDIRKPDDAPDLVAARAKEPKEPPQVEPEVPAPAAGAPAS